MRLEVLGCGYQTAAGAFVDANQLSALCFTRLAGRLSSYAGMAGDDSTSQEFAAAYDDGAREALSSLADLVDSCSGLGRLTTTSLANHTRANVRSIAVGATVYEGGDLPEMGDHSAYVSVLPTTPPTSLGADTPLLPDQVRWILDHIEGFVWPGADVDRLRDAAGAWRAAATGLDGLVPCCDSAIRAFWRERSPEIPLAIDATHELRTSIAGLADQFASLAAACDSYADAVEAKRAEILHLAEWLLEQVVEGVVISVALGAITGGAGTAAGLSAVVARVAAESPRFAAILEALRALAAGVAASVRAAREALQTVRITLTKFHDATVARSLARGEAGTLKLWWEREPGWLVKHEHSGSHTLKKHVGKTNEELLQRLRDQPGLSKSSTFTSQEVAESEMSRLLASRDAEVSQWLADGRRPLELDTTASQVVGRCAFRSGTIVDSSSFRVVLVRDASMPEGYRILTAFPTP
ncbi:RNase A-like domain-containing protein [Nocardioides ungokensis]|uniref:RNase A-like domain-containing protein n=1 Tax=Nocardioides ungokensis TaxID=1643322 RepID=UPI0015DF77AD|nr:RNase A-like domain-containing protein [Nocardioides ungokensis]